jgi:hypothetical protein
MIRWFVFGKDPTATPDRVQIAKIKKVNNSRHKIKLRQNSSKFNFHKMSDVKIFFVKF